MIQTNPYAPHLTGELTRACADQIKDMHKNHRVSAYATPDTAVIRRDLDEDHESILRPAFVRDVEKIIHTPAYNRLAGKTQVFSFRSNDDLTRRNLHVQLVARVARDIGRALGLNLDLIEAIGLGHDIGHTPFGHIGERYVSSIYHAYTGGYFFHNVQSVRSLDTLYKRNLSLQVLDGIICHNGEFEQQVIKTSNLSTFDEYDHMVARAWHEGEAYINTLRPMTLEGCVVRLCDIIAYVGKDRQDAILAGLCDEHSFSDGLGGTYNSWALSAFVADCVEHSLGKDHIELSDEAFCELARAKKENYDKIYMTAEVDGKFGQHIQQLFQQVFDHELDAVERNDTHSIIYRHHIEPVSQHLSHYGYEYAWQKNPIQTVTDFIASMTDSYFIDLCRHLLPDSQDIFPSYPRFHRFEY